MISHIYGEITDCSEGYVVIDVGGIGYQVNVTKSIFKELSGRKDKVKLHTYLHVREDAFLLYGFLTYSELLMFKLLISVNRVGPQIAMNILSRIKIEELAAAIIHEDEKVLTSISGVGSKNARRLILELKDKMKKKMEGIAQTATCNINNDAVSALVSLGFIKQEAEKAVGAVSGGEQTLEDLIKASLLKLKEEKS